MGKHRKSKLSSTSGGASKHQTTSSSAPQTENNTPAPLPPFPAPKPPIESSLWEWVFVERRGLPWVIVSILIGWFVGFLLGAGVLLPGQGWRLRLAHTMQNVNLLEGMRNLEGTLDRMVHYEDPLRHPANPLVFHVLREAVVREKGGYVHPDLGVLHPAPSGAVRGLGMVSDTHYRCQKHCFPGNEEERRSLEYPVEGETYKQEEVLIRVPLSFQMTRDAAMPTLNKIIPNERRPLLNELDDAAILVLYLAHERGVGKYSQWLPYIASLPLEPSCGYSRHLRQSMLDAVQVYNEELDVDTEGWNEELLRAQQYADRIVVGLEADFGSFLTTPEYTTCKENLEWALCQVSSRATAGASKYGSLRMVPLMDLINHDINAGGFIELKGTERIGAGDFVDAEEDDAGTFVVRSLRHGRWRPLRKGQEILVNYNVPHYSPLDWIVNLGFVPPERWGPWQRIEPVMPQLRRDGNFDTEVEWAGREERLREYLQKSEL